MASEVRHAGPEADPHPMPPSEEHLLSQPEETKGYLLNHLMYRIKDPAVSLPFYENILGLRSIMKFNTGPFTIYYLSYPKEGETTKTRLDGMQTGQGLIELIHVHGTEHDDKFKILGGNELGKLGFGHLGLSVPDVPAAMKRFHELGVTVIKDVGDMRPKALVLQDESYLPGAGFMNHVFVKIGFIADPDGYWIEIVPLNGFAP